MNKEKHAYYIGTNLSQFVDKLRADCYAKIEKLCENISQQTNTLRTHASQSISQYTSACNDLISEITAYMIERREKYMPYFEQLSVKADTNHDCSNCSGSCKLNHDLYLIEFKASHAGIKNILTRLQMTTLPLYSDTAFADSYRVLRAQMALLESELSELFFLEENYLLPKITEAQKMIHAGSK